MLRDILIWYGALQAMAVVGWPAAFAALRRLPSRGYATAKALGLLLTGVVLWWGGILHLWQNTPGAALMAGGLVLAVGLRLMRGMWPQVLPWWREHRRHVLVVEVLFLAALLAWALVRAAQPQLQTAGGEKWMEIAFLNANLRAPSMPPHDPWLSGYAISYYYLGYLILSVPTRLTQISPTVAFNLGNAGWFALVAIQAYGLVYDMAKRRATIRALIAPLLMLVAGNGEGLLEMFHARGLLPAAFWQWMDINRLREPPQPPFTWVPQRFFWWWQASRTIQDRTPWGELQEVIDEFPAFSFLLGDMHPHLLALPFVLVAVALALHAYRQAIETPPAVAEAGTPQPRLPRLWASMRARLVPLLGYAAVVGALGFLNTWDFPIYWALIVGAWIIGRYAQVEKATTSFFAVVWAVVPEAIALGILSVALYAPFWIALRSQAGGILPNLFNATKLQQFVVMFLPLLIPVAGLVIGAAARRGIPALRAIGLGVALMLGIALAGLLIGAASAYPYLQVVLRGESVQGYTLTPEAALVALRDRLLNPWTGLLLAMGVGTTILAIIQRPRHADRPNEGKHPVNTPDLLEVDGFAVLLALVGLLLTLAPEFVYLQDVFMTRMNTIFKFYFQAWVLWSLAGAWQLSRWLETGASRAQQTTRRYVAVTASFLLIACGLVYTVLAIPARAREQGVPWTLDGAAWLAESHPEDHAAIAWLNANIPGAPTIVEAPGDAHRAYIYEGRVSAMTGLPTLLGWGGHQLQWRGNYDEPARREVDLDMLFATTDPLLTQTILDRYDVRYIYIGPTERQRYAGPGLDKFEALFPAVYDVNGVAIYKVE